MKFKPLHHFLHIEKVTFEELKKTKGGIVIPDNLKGDAAAFRVIATGPGFFDVMSASRVPMSVKPDDLVLINVHEVVNVGYAGRECLVCPETAAFGTITFDVKPEDKNEESSD